MNWLIDLYFYVLYLVFCSSTSAYSMHAYFLIYVCLSFSLSLSLSLDGSFSLSFFRYSMLPSSLYVAASGCMASDARWIRQSVCQVSLKPQSPEAAHGDLAQIGG